MPHLGYCAWVRRKQHRGSSIYKGGKAMKDLNLVLQFKMAGDTNCRISSAARIKVDGRGGLTFYSPETGSAERIDLADLRWLSIRFLGPPAEPLRLVM